MIYLLMALAALVPGVMMNAAESKEKVLKEKVLIVGASSGIGRALAAYYSKEGHEVGLLSRRIDALQELQKQLPSKSYARQADITQPEEAVREMLLLLSEMKSADIIIINSGVYHVNPNLVWEKDKTTIDVNITGFTAIANAAMHYFMEKGCGHLVGISSVSAIRGEAYSPVYSASKAFISNFLEGLRHRMAQEKRAICITDIQPGYIDTDMTKEEETFWMVSPEEAAQEIYAAIMQKRTHAYITSRWRLWAWSAKYAPNWLYDLLF